MWQGCFDKEQIINEYQIKTLFILKKQVFFRTSFLLYYKHIFRAQNLFYKKQTLKINVLYCFNKIPLPKYKISES